MNGILFAVGVKYSKYEIVLKPYTRMRHFFQSLHYLLRHKRSSCGILGQAWYLIVLILDICSLLQNNELYLFLCVGGGGGGNNL